MLSIDYPKYKIGLDVLIEAFSLVKDLNERKVLYLIGDRTDQKIGKETRAP